MKVQLKWWQWALVAFFGLAIVGALIPAEDDEDKTATVVTQTVAEASEETPATTAEEEAPEQVDLSVQRPGEGGVVYKDQIVLRGKVTRGATVLVDDERASVQKGRWTKQVSLDRGSNEFTIEASKTGMDDSEQGMTVTRKESAAERAERRRQQAERRRAKAERRANMRALRSAESYLAMSGMSKKGLYQQLSSAAGEGFTPAQAQYAVDHVDADWNAEAVESARSYLEMSPMSKNELIQQLSSAAGEGFTYEQALYAVNKVY